MFSDLSDIVKANSIRSGPPWRSQLCCQPQAHQHTEQSVSKNSWFRLTLHEHDKLTELLSIHAAVSIVWKCKYCCCSEQISAVPKPNVCDRYCLNKQVPRWKEIYEVFFTFPVVWLTLLLSDKLFKLPITYCWSPSTGTQSVCLILFKIEGRNLLIQWIKHQLILNASGG